GDSRRGGALHHAGEPDRLVGRVRAPQHGRHRCANRFASDSRVRNDVALTASMDHGLSRRRWRKFGPRAMKAPAPTLPWTRMVGYPSWAASLALNVMTENERRASPVESTPQVSGTMSVSVPVRAATSM